MAKSLEEQLQSDLTTEIINKSLKNTKNAHVLINARAAQKLSSIIKNLENVKISPTEYAELRKQHDLEANLDFRDIQKNITNRTVIIDLINQVDIKSNCNFSNMIKCSANQECIQKSWNFINDVVTNNNDNVAPQLLINGESKSGKSYLAAVIANELINNGKQVWWLNFRKYIQELIKNWSSENCRKISKRLFETTDEILVLDDAVSAAEKINEIWAGRLASVIRARNIANLSTIIITNSSDISALRKKVGEYCFGGILDLSPKVIYMTKAMLKEIYEIRKAQAKSSMQKE